MSENTSYRARPLSESQSLVDRVKTLQPEQRVVVTAKNILKSSTLVINGALFIVATIVSLLDILFNAKVVEPIVELFTSDPDTITTVITVITQFYTTLNILLRLKTTQPVTMRRDMKE
jgi:hypothetical protein